MLFLKNFIKPTGLCWLVVVVFFAATHVVAQEEDFDENSEIEELVVVGSAIKRFPIDAPHSVTVLDRNTLALQGSPLIVDVMKNLGASNGVVGERNGWYNSSLPAAIPESASNINLRGLGASRTLVLFNGKRQNYLPARLIGGRFVDLSVLPSIAVERVEILKEGASAIYGSDAIGGIANFATRKGFSGLETFLTVDSFDQSQDMTVGAIWGTTVADSNLVVAYEYEQRGELESEDRDWALQPLQDPWRAGWSSVGNPGYFWFPTGLDTATTPRDQVISTLKAVQWSGKKDPVCNGLNGYPNHPAVDPYYCIFNYQPFDNLIEETTFGKLFVELNGDLGNGRNYHLELLVANSNTPQWQTQPSHPPFPLLHRGVMEVSPDHPNRIAFCADSTYSQTFQDECTANENWYWRGRPFGNGYEKRTAEREANNWRLAGTIAGVGEFAAGKEYDWEISMSYSSASGNVAIPAILTERLFLAFRGYGGPNCGVGVIADNTLGPGMRVAPTTKDPGTMGCEYINPFSSSVQNSSLPGAPYYDTPNPFYDPAQRNSPELIDWLNSVSDINSETSLFVAGATVSAPIFEKGAFAAGYQFRNFNAIGAPNDHGNLSLNPCPVIGDTNCQTGEFGVFTFINAYNPYDENQGVHRIFAELALIHSERLDTQFAINFENYEQASSLDPKVALRFQLSDQVVFRTSAQTTFRTPSVDDLLEEIPLTVTQLISQVGAWIPVDIYGDADLEPERALTYNFGLIFTQDSGIEVTLDYWIYNFEDVIGSLPHDTIDDLFADASTSDAVSQFIYCADGRVDQINTPCGPRSITRVEVPLVNYPGVDTSGFDWQARNNMDFGNGVLQLGTTGTYTFAFDVHALSYGELQIQDAVEGAGKLNFGNPLLVPIPKWKTQTYAMYYTENYSFGVYLNHISSYEDDGAHDGYGGVEVSSFDVASFTTVDATLQWLIPNQPYDISISLLNLTDEPPPFANVEHAYDGMTHNPKGRRFKVSLRYSMQ